MTLGKLIEWLEGREDAIVHYGFGDPHTDRGFYEDLAFDPEQTTTYGQMLAHARSAVGATYGGWKGGDYKMHEYTECRIGEFGDCGEEITSAQLRLWELTKEAKP